MILDICSNPTTLKIFKIVRIVINIIKIVVPIILIVTLMITLMNEVSNNNSDLKEASGLIVKKVAAAVLVFLIPTIVSIISNSIGFNSNNFISCINNSTDENIEKMQIRYIDKLIDQSKTYFNGSKYNNIKSEIDKLNDNTLRNEYMDRLDKMQEEWKKNRKIEEDEFDHNTNTTPDPDPNVSDVVNTFVNNAIDMANDESHGYCNRPDCNQLPDVDCGTFVSYNLRSVGLLGSGEFMNPNDPYEAIGTLCKYGFKMYGFDRNSLKKGDIVIRYGHTEIYIGNGQSVGAHGNSDADGYKINGFQSGPNTLAGDQSGGEVSIDEVGDFTNIIRYEGEKVNLCN